jgi:comEA protein
MKTRILIALVLVAALAGEALAVNATTATAGQININTATVQELQKLPRVGPSLAQRIVDFRVANGPFKTPNELTRVKGIGEKTFALMESYVVTNGPTTLSEKIKVARSKSAKTVATK